MAAIFFAAVAAAAAAAGAGREAGAETKAKKSWGFGLLAFLVVRPVGPSERTTTAAV